MRWHEAPLLPLSAALALGIVAAGWTAAAPGWLLAAGGLLLAVGACAAALGRDSAATAGLLALAVTLGALRGATERLPADHIARAELPPIVKMEGRLAEEPVRWAPDRTRLILDVDGFFDGADRRPASGRLQVTLYGETAAVGEGQRVSAELRLSRPRGFRNPGAFDYRAFLRREGILLVGSGRAESLVPLTADEPPWPVRIKRWAVAAIGARCLAAHDRGGGGHGAGRLRPHRGRSGLGAPRHRHGASAAGGHPPRPEVSAHERARTGRARAPRLAPRRSLGPGLPAFLRRHRRNHSPHALHLGLACGKGLAGLARDGRGGERGRPGGRDARHARPLQPALARRHRGQSRRGPAGRGGHNPRDAGAPGCPRERDRGRRALPRAVARAPGPARGSLGRRRGSGGDDPSAGARLGGHPRLVRDARSRACPQRATVDTRRGRVLPRGGARAVRLALGAAGRWPASRHLPGRGSGRRDPRGATRGAAAPGGRRPRGSPAPRRGRAGAGAIPLESPRGSPGRGRGLAFRPRSLGRAPRRAHALPRWRAVGERPVGPGQRGYAAGRGAIGRLPPDARRGAADVARLGPPDRAES